MDVREIGRGAGPGGTRPKEATDCINMHTGPAPSFAGGSHRVPPCRELNFKNTKSYVAIRITFYSYAL